MLRQRLFLAGKWAVLDLHNPQHRGRPDDVLYAGRIVHTGQLHQDAGIAVGAPFLLHNRFSQA